MNIRPLRVVLLYGTRPEAIKMAPVIEALRRRPDDVRLTVCTTAQHRELLDQAQEVLGIRADVDLDLMRPDQDLNALASRAFTALGRVLEEEKPEWLLVQGDTTTAMVGAFAGFHLGVKVGHVEAGLRTGDLRDPFPEEANRRAIDFLAEALFAPTERAHRALLTEGADPEKVYLTGNTVVDALHLMSRHLPERRVEEEVLITVHRRESFGRGLRGIFAALRELASAFPKIRWIFPVHRNPNVWQPAHELLAGIRNLELLQPLDYFELLGRLRSARLVLTDSGGIQEEAPSFGTPVFILRDRTERPEGVEAGVAKLVGTDRSRIVAEVSRFLNGEGAAPRAKPVNVYGDGHAAQRIVAVLTNEEFVPYKAG